jgi:signal transduction histidine kinase
MGGTPGGARSIALARAHDAGTAVRPLAAVRSWAGRLLGVSLAAKLAGANVLLVAGTATAAWLTHLAGLSDRGVLVLVGVLVALTLVTNVVLVHLALRPVMELQRVADRVWRGDLDARVEQSLLADRDLARVGEALNRVLEGLLADRGRLRHLARAVIRAGESERARLAHELHDSTAQTLAALVFEIAALGVSLGREQQEQLATARQLASTALEEVRTLALTVHSRVLDDLGLPAALETLARELTRDGGPEISVEADDSANGLPAEAAAVLYAVAREAASNAVRHGGARHVTLRLTGEPERVTMEVFDDGRGFDVEATERRRAGLGLFSMRERVALADGSFKVASARGAGTRVVATVPVTSAA